MLSKFEVALKNHLRWNYKGLLNLEDLFCLNLKDLDKIYSDLDLEIRNTQSTGLLAKTENDELSLLNVKKDIVEYIFVEKQKAAMAMKAAIDSKNHRQKIMGIIAAKKDQALMDMDISELEAMLDEDE